MSNSDLTTILNEIACYIEREKNVIAEWRELHAGDWHIMGEANVKAACLADLIRFYERLKQLE
ncbi:hypothetical protein [Bacillus sp. JJ722]|uniref:hypothetical protein n=1 Tax=Bacillus sp. JJ722 TaxID=3122973 RepID=UPI002FFD5BA2